MPTHYTGSDTYPASYDIPSGGDARNAVSVNTGLEALGDRTTWIKNRTGIYRLVKLSDSGIVDTPLSTLGSSTSLTWGTGDVALCNPIPIETDDVIEVEVGFHAFTSDPTSLCGYRLAWAVDGGAKTQIPGAQIIYGRDLHLAEPAFLRGTIWPGEGYAGNMVVYLQMMVGYGYTISVVSPLCPIVRVWRDNA
jgi:hypothetical protein